MPTKSEKSKKSTKSAKSKKSGGKDSKKGKETTQPEKVRPIGRNCWSHKKLTIPYLAGLQNDTMRAGQSIFLKGAANNHPKNINICLAAGKEVCDDNLIRKELPGCNVVLRIHMKFDDKNFIFSSFNTKNKNSAWEDDETADLNIKPGEDFDLRIRSVENSFEIWSQGTRVYKYNYKGPRNSTSYVLINGDLELNRCAWEGHYYDIPFDVKLGDTFLPGRTMYIAGVCRKAKDVFTVELKDEDDKSMFLLKADFGKKSVTGSLPFLSKFPFALDKCFDIVLKFDQAGVYPVYVDGKEFSKKQNRTADIGKALEEGKSVVPFKLFVKGEIELQAIRT